GGLTPARHGRRRPVTDRDRAGSVCTLHGPARRPGAQDSDSPPSTVTTVPVMNRDAGDDKKYPASPRSDGSAARPMGTLATASANGPGFPAVSGVSVIPGDSALTRIP